ncbi:hypothetical protein PIB30_066790 [Stylosanthes scabra]|uniref:Uncharacterized protein n=1 Tax=Stylosanthes scabra TaxID=79078 RepID=A0ABU6XKN4_9FABA|nr:hypothetical protein [Stylosanthes scabra]
MEFSRTFMLAVLPCELSNHQGRAGLLNREGNPSFLPRRQGMTHVIPHSLSRTPTVIGFEILLQDNHLGRDNSKIHNANVPTLQPSQASPKVAVDFFRKLRAQSMPSQSSRYPHQLGLG